MVDGGQILIRYGIFSNWNDERESSAMKEGKETDKKKKRVRLGSSHGNFWYSRRRFAANW